MEYQFAVYPNNFEVNFLFHKLMNLSTREVFEIRRLAFSPLMPLKVQQPLCSDLINFIDFVD